MLGVVNEAPDKAQITRCLPNFNVNVQVGFDQAYKLYFVDNVGDNLSKQEDFWQKRLSSLTQESSRKTDGSNPLRELKTTWQQSKFLFNNFRC